MKRYYQILFAIAFFAILIIPLRYQTFSPSDLDANFYGRARLIQLFTTAKVFIGDKVFPKAIVGEDGWLFYTAEKTLDDYQHAIPFSDQELAKIQENLDAVTAEYDARGISLVVIIAPNKSTIYGDFMPDGIRVLRQHSRLEQLIAYLKSHGQTQILDLRPALMQARQTKQVYYKTDTHWNDYGAHVAYKEIMKVLHEDFPVLQAHGLDDFEYKSYGAKPMDLARNIGATNLREEKFDLVPEYSQNVRVRLLSLDNGRKVTLTYNENKLLPTAVVYHDSFFFQVIPMLSPHFKRAIYVPHYSGGDIWSLAWVEEQQPDIVIVEFSERYIHDIPRLIHP